MGGCHGFNAHELQSGKSHPRLGMGWIRGPDGAYVKQSSPTVRLAVERQAQRRREEREEAFRLAGEREAQRRREAREERERKEREREIAWKKEMAQFAKEREKEEARKEEERRFVRPEDANRAQRRYLYGEMDASLLADLQRIARERYPTELPVVGTTKAFLHGQYGQDRGYRMNGECQVNANGTVVLTGTVREEVLTGYRRREWRVCGGEPWAFTNRGVVTNHDEEQGLYYIKWDHGAPIVREDSKGTTRPYPPYRPEYKSGQSRRQDGIDTIKLSDLNKATFGEEGAFGEEGVGRR